MQAFSAVVTAAVFAAASPAFADAQSQVHAARKAERRGEWQKALDSWKAAYAADGNAEWLIGIGDASAHLGNKEEAKKNYEAYLADPLALPANLEKVKAKIAALKPALALPGAGLPLPIKNPSAATEDPKAKKAPAPIALPALDLPAAPPVQVASKEAPLSLPGVDTPVSSRKDDGKKIASASAALELPLPGGTSKAQPTPAAKKDAEPAVASRPATTGKPIAMITPAPAAPKAPVSAVSDTPAPRGHPDVAGGTQRTVAYVAAAVAIVALGGGAYAFTQASSAHSDLTGKVHAGATAQQLLETERRNKTLSFVGLSGGLVAAGIATALFAF